MDNNAKTFVTIDDVQYQLEDMTPEQQGLISHLADLDQKLAAAKFSADQLQVCRNAFFGILKQSLNIAK
tara:strand:- start:45 stop:251 length:207 start_codon:yes stop_codon:yes gene_type:complete